MDVFKNLEPDGVLSAADVKEAAADVIQQLPRGGIEGSSRSGTACFRPHSHSYRNHESPACRDSRFGIPPLSSDSSLVSE